jgi:hypothetical protein
MQRSSQWRRVQCAALLVAGVGVVLAGCGKRAPAPRTEVVAVQAAVLPSTPADPAWNAVPALLLVQADQHGLAAEASQDRQHQF